MQQLASPASVEPWLRARGAMTLRTDSRQVRAGDAFVAWPGWATDGRRFVRDALAAGAVACLVEAEGADAFGFEGDPRIASLPGLKAATGPIADAWFGRPSERLQMVAVTGTNGKTSTACWTAQALAQSGRRCGVIGTLGVGEFAVAAQDHQPGAAANGIVATGLTTPDPVTLHGALAGFVERGCAACALEASSIGLVEHRLDATHVDVALFTNLTRDHLDYHGTMQAYWAAKRRLFAWPGLRAAVVNVDDEHGALLADELRTRGLDLWTVSSGGVPVAEARLQALALRYTESGLAFEVREGARQATLQTALVGDFNASNLLVVLGALRALGLALDDAVAALAHASPVPGRLQRLSGAGIDVVVDYAHTPDALAKALAALRPMAAARGGRLVCVFGCGGNRDATKRPLMGAIAARDADRVLLTSDNPRDEPPAAILAQILAGVTAHEDVAVIENRAEAIATAVAEARRGDVVLLAGKGHEDYQEIAGVKRPFSDLTEARAALAQRSAREAEAAPC